VKRLAKEKIEEQTTLQCFVRFQKIKKKDKDLAYAKFATLIEENKDVLPVKATVNHAKKRILLDAKDFAFEITFGKMILVNIMVNNPYENKAIVNEVSSKVINYLNTVLNEGANGARVACSLMTITSKKKVNLAEKLLGEGRIARVNEIVGQSLKPLSIGFEYKLGEKNFMLSLFSSKSSVQILASSTVYKDKMPFNLLEKEIGELDHPVSTIKRLSESEV
jgi:hypothetical protein